MEILSYGKNKDTKWGCGKASGDGDGNGCAYDANGVSGAGSFNGKLTNWSHGNGSGRGTGSGWGLCYGVSDGSGDGKGEG